MRDKDSKESLHPNPDESEEHHLYTPAQHELKNAIDEALMALEPLPPPLPADEEIEDDDAPTIPANSPYHMDELVQDMADLLHHPESRPANPPVEADPWVENMVGNNQTLLQEMQCREPVEPLRGDYLEHSTGGYEVVGEVDGVDEVDSVDDVGDIDDIDGVDEEGVEQRLSSVRSRRRFLLAAVFACGIMAIILVLIDVVISVATAPDADERSPVEVGPTEVPSAEAPPVQVQLPQPEVSNPPGEPEPSVRERETRIRQARAELEALIESIAGPDADDDHQSVEQLALRLAASPDTPLAAAVSTRMGGSFNDIKEGERLSYALVWRLGQASLSFTSEQIGQIEEQLSGEISDGLTEAIAAHRQWLREWMLGKRGLYCQVRERYWQEVKRGRLELTAEVKKDIKRLRQERAKLAKAAGYPTTVLYEYCEADLVGDTLTTESTVRPSASGPLPAPTD